MSSGGTETEYVASPQQQEAMGFIMPMIQRLGMMGAGPYAPQQQAPQAGPVSSGMGPVGGPRMQNPYDPYGDPYERQMYRNWIPSSIAKQTLQPTQAQPTAEPIVDDPLLGAPLAPQMPSAQGVNTSMLAPQQGWFSGLDSSIKQGLWEPVNEASRVMQEQMGRAGQWGSARGGMSGAAGAAMGELYGRASPQIGMQAWNMLSPHRTAQYQLGMMDYQNEANRLMQDYGTAKHAWQMPYSLLGMTPQLMPTNVVTQQPGFGLMDAATLGLMGGSALFGGGTGLIPGIMGLFR